MSGINAGAINSYEVNGASADLGDVIATSIVGSSEVVGVTVLVGEVVSVTPIESSEVPNIGVNDSNNNAVNVTPWTSSTVPNINLSDSLDNGVTVDPWVSSQVFEGIFGENDGTSVTLAGVNSFVINESVINGDFLGVSNNTVDVIPWMSSHFDSLPDVENFFENTLCLKIDYVPPEQRVDAVPGRRGNICR